MNSRIKSIQELLAKKGLGAFLVTSPHNIFYLTNLQSLDPSHREVIALVTKKKTYLFASPLLSLKNTLPPKKLAQKLGQYRKVGFESTNFTYVEYVKLKKISTLVPTENMIEALRQIKDPSEISAISAACHITSVTMNWIKSQLRPGVTEKTLAWTIEKHLRKQGADSLAFPVIVASGPNSAIPHHNNSHRTLRTNDIVLLDFGCKVNGYCSDITRTFFIGKPTDLQLKVASIVKEAHAAALRALTSGVSISTPDVDKVARTVITSAGFGKNFIHSTGHGLGLDIHESPSLSSSSSLPKPYTSSSLRLPEPNGLYPNMVFTIEPGVYIPGKFGYRHEDTILYSSPIKVLTALTE